MAWYTHTRSNFSPTSSIDKKPALYPALYKTIQPPFHDSNFRSLCSNTATKVVFAHIRAATLKTSETPTTAVTPPNNHPFTFGIHTVMHNGYITDFDRIKRQMCAAMSKEAYNHIAGSTDTEHFAALLMTFLCPSNTTAPELSSSPSNEESEGAIPAAWGKHHTATQMKEALLQTIATIISLQKSTLATPQPNDLNIAVTDGRSLVACRFRNHATEQPPNLYYSTTAGVTLSRQYPDHPDGANGPYGGGNGRSVNGKEAVEGAEGYNPYASKDAGEHGRHVIVASEPSTYKIAEWTLVKKNHVVIVEGGELVEVLSMGLKYLELSQGGYYLLYTR
jgi:glutamine amidotransferase